MKTKSKYEKSKEIYDRLQDWVQDNIEEFTESVFGHTNYLVVYDKESDTIKSRSYVGSRTKMQESEIKLLEWQDHEHWNPPNSMKENLLCLQHAISKGYIELEKDWIMELSNRVSKIKLNEEQEEFCVKNHNLLLKANLYMSILDDPKSVLNTSSGRIRDRLRFN